ncbi:hypothetical protein Mahau_0071 [Mahella australiensis 50-1 BON]|uniref:Uncharacterized protein n=2 Tax=Mahella TaxID=252965 RepID=F3ZVE4_MAHA5|nr:hypothetical protein Mahau_0071 [Mahella australiensis 50-1 BON]
MPFKIDNTKISNKAWSDVDKSAIWQRLKAGLDEDAAGTREAIREMYAVVKAAINDDLTQADCWGPHHEIQQDGTLVLNRGGVIAAAQALAGARTEPNLTSEQIAEAKQHLRRHYEQLELPIPDALGEMAEIAATISSEIAVNDVPLAPGANLEALKSGDDDPLEVVVEIPAGKSKRGWNYTPQVIQKIAGEVALKTATGFLGHQKPEDVDHTFPTPVTHWVGALYKDGKAYIRGVIDAAAKDLKRWIRAGRVKQVSIYGMPTLQQAAGETQVVDYQLLSIDWTPLDRAGMPTSIVAIGEMADFISEPITISGGARMTLQETLAKLKELGVTPGQIAGEMGWSLDSMANEVDSVAWESLQAATKAIGEIAAMFNLKDAKTDDLIKAVKEAREVQDQMVKARREAIIDKVIGEMVTVEAARPLVKRMLNVPDDADEETVKKAVGEMLTQDDIKQAMTGIFKQDVIRPVINDKSADSGMTIVKARI